MTSRALRRLSTAAVVATYLLIVWGGIVRVTGSGLGCDDPSGAKNGWPLCAGGLLPPSTSAGVIEFTHRWLAAIATALVLALALVVVIRYRHVRRLVVAASVTVVLFVVQIVLGAATVEFKLPPWVILLHLATALLLLGAVTFIAVAAFTVGDRSVRWSRPPQKSRLALAAAIVTYAVILTGSNVVAQEAGAACNGWPFCDHGGFGFTLSGVGLDAVNLFHRLATGVLLLLLVATVPIVWRAHPGDRGLFAVGMAILLLLLLQIIVGALVVEWRLPAWIRGIHLALASALWASTVLFALLARREAVRRSAPLPPRRWSWAAPS